MIFTREPSRLLTRRRVRSISTATERGPTERHLYRTSLDTDTPNDIERLSTESGIHSVSLAPDARFYVDAFTSVSQPPEVRIHSINGGVSATLLENKLDDTHPDAPFFATEFDSRIWRSSSGGWPSAALSDLQAAAFRFEQALSCDHRRIWRPRCAKSAQRMDGCFFHADF